MYTEAQTYFFLRLNWPNSPAKFSKYKKTRMALNRAHTSAKVQKSRLNTVQQMPGITYPVLQGMNWPSPNHNAILLAVMWNINLNPNPTSTLTRMKC